jgi:ParB-like chromosome segregation protein Spo0J
VTAAESLPVPAPPAGAPDAADGAWVRIDDLRSDLSLRVDGPSHDHVAALAALVGPLPAIVVQRDSMRVVDGLHRLLAARARGAERVQVTWVDGDEVEGLLLAVRLNGVQGLPLSRRDRAAAVEQLLRRRPHWSDRRIAAELGVTHRTVGAVRRRSSGEIPRPNAGVGQDGRVRPHDPAAGRRRAARLIAERPGASLRAIGAAAGVSPATVLDVRRRLERGMDPVRDRARTGDADGRPAPARPTAADPAEVARCVDALRDDPSLRYSGTGRALLRLLVGTLGLERPEALVACLPTYSRSAAATLARLCADTWLRIAAELDARS